MNFNKHSNLEGQHAFLGASNYHWINYDENTLAEVYSNRMAALKGTIIHSFAKSCIELGQKLPRSTKTLNLYVNDAIGFHMTPEQILYFSENCFGTADSISFRGNELRIHDLKTGNTPGHMEQLMVYAALFCLEYQINPEALFIELRIYQNDEMIFCNPEPEKIREIMNKIIRFDKMIETWKKREE